MKICVCELSARDVGRLNKALERRYNFGDEGVMSLREYLKRKDTPEHKYVYTRHYGKQGDHLKRLRKEYSLWWGREGIGVPKMVWDRVDVPIQEREQRCRQCEEGTKEVSTNPFMKRGGW